MNLWLTVAGGLVLFILGLLGKGFYPLVNALWLLYTLGLVGLLILWARHIDKSIENLAMESPDPELTKNGFPVACDEFSRVDRNIEKVYRKLEVAEFNLINQKARQAGENFNLMLSSTTGRLTCVPNRAELDRHISKVAGRITPLSVIMMDIDHFKKVNDTYGHDAGDVVLKEFARTVKSAIRPMDFLGRYGGEEFVVICNACIDEASEIAGRVRLTVSAAPVSISEGQALSITASFGVAGYRPGDNPETLIKRADTALYEAKKAGRNRVVRGGVQSFAG
ncbi:MAG: GGDEF domain-containing protein [Bacillota bacterium]